MYCIYRITNKLNGHTYIGQHKYTDNNDPMRKYKGSGKLLRAAYAKYGIDKFETEILYRNIRDKSTVDAMEIWAIKKYKPEYNIAEGGSGGNTYSKHRDLNRLWNNMIRDYLSVYYGRYWSNKGYKKTEDQLNKWKESWYSKSRTSWNKGKHASDEQKKKQSLAMTGRQAWNKGKKKSPEEIEHWCESWYSKRRQFSTHKEDK